MSDIDSLLEGRRHRWLLTGVAGFIGSNILEALLAAGQEVVGLDNFATGHRHNLTEVEATLPDAYHKNFRFVEGDIRDRDTCREAVEGVTYVLHQAALGSVPRSIADPLTSHDVNVTGFVNMIDAARHEGVDRFVYAASSSTYGDEPNLPKMEDRIGNPLSPYAATKFADEIYAGVWARSYGLESVGLRYFNVFGERQDPNGAYAAVIPKWVAAMLQGRTVTINGDGETSRDFCYVANAVQANIRAAITPVPNRHQVYNVALGDQTSLNRLFEMLREKLGKVGHPYAKDAEYGDFRPGDVRHSRADTSKAVDHLGYEATHRVDDGLDEALPWYIEKASKGEPPFQSA